MTGQRQLDKDAVDRGVFVQAAHLGQQFLVADALRQFNERTVDPHEFGGTYFPFHVRTARRVVPYNQNRQARPALASGHGRGDLVPDIFLNAHRQSFPVNYLAHNVAKILIN